MTQHLAGISRHVAKDAHAILIMDQAGWRTSNNLIAPKNITILPLPPKSPELNPVENLWQVMRETGSQTASSNHAAISSNIAATHGVNSKDSHGEQCLSVTEIGRMSSNHRALVQVWK